MIELLPTLIYLVLWAFSLVSIPFAVFHRQWDTRLAFMVPLFGATTIAILCSRWQIGLIIFMLFGPQAWAQ